MSTIDRAMTARARLLSGIGCEVVGLTLVAIPGYSMAFWVGMVALIVGAGLAVTALR